MNQKTIVDAKNNFKVKQYHILYDEKKLLAFVDQLHTKHVLEFKNYNCLKLSKFQETLLNELASLQFAIYDR